MVVIGVVRLEGEEKHPTMWVDSYVHVGEVLEKRPTAWEVTCGCCYVQVDDVEWLVGCGGYYVW